MKTRANRIACMAFALLALVGPAWAEDLPAFTRQEDVVYGRKDGMALTLDVLTPSQANGAAVIWVVSGGWFSSHEAIQPAAVATLLQRGYTVFAVVHGSQPRYTIPDAVADLTRSVRFIRSNADTFHVDPQRLGITGGSAGGHLSLMIGTTGDDGDPAAKDPVQRAGSRVQAVACFFPPTDFLNYGKTGSIDLGTKTLVDFRAPFDFVELDRTQGHGGRFVLITDEARRQEIGRAISPITHVSSDDPPALIIHGDADTLVPIQQSESILARYRDAGVESKLIVKPGAGHGWNLQEDWGKIADWFDAHLKPAAEK